MLVIIKIILNASVRASQIVHAEKLTRKKIIPIYLQFLDIIFPISFQRRKIWGQYLNSLERWGGFIRGTKVTNEVARLTTGCTLQ